MVLLAVSFSIQTTVNAQATYITVYGQLTQFQCPVGAISGPCTGFGLTTNGTTPGIPNYPMLDFSQSVVPAPAQSDVGKLIMATGYYGQESPCTIVNSCPAFFVHIWGPYYGGSSSSTTSSTCFFNGQPTSCLASPGIGCWQLSNNVWTQSQCASAISGHESSPTNTWTVTNPTYQVGFLQLTGPQIALGIVVLAALGYLFLRRRK
jgi:hypothetical protein